MMSALRVQKPPFTMHDVNQQVMMEKAWLRKHEVYLFPAFEHAIIKARSEREASEFVKKELGEEPVIVPASNGVVETAAKVIKRKRGQKSGKKRGRPPKAKRPKTTALNGVDQQNKKKVTTHYRVKWSDEDVELLWNAIRTCGNKWSLIKARLFPKRTNDQVKDKGKRLLRRLGWETGITKSDSICACASAKRLASAYLANRNLTNPASEPNPAMPL